VISRLKWTSEHEWIWSIPGSLRMLDLCSSDQRYTCTHRIRTRRDRCTDAVTRTTNNDKWWTVTAAANTTFTETTAQLPSHRWQTKSTRSRTF